MEELFNSSFGVKLGIPQVVSEIIAFMQAAPEYEYRITIGTDSELLSSKQADFVSAIVVHRVGNGGRYFWRRGTLGKFHTLRDRIIREVLLSLDVARETLISLQKMEQEKALPKWDFAIHADVGENGPTKAMIQEVVGIIRAHNFEARTKPESYAATNVADRYV